MYSTPSLLPNDTIDDTSTSEIFALGALFDASIPATKIATKPSALEADASFPTVITKNTVRSIREHIKVTIRPEWQAHLPENFGAAEHGKLKADQWRTALEFDLPVSLVQILSDGKLHGSVENDRLRRIVEITLDLAMALAWGLSRRTSTSHAENYLFYMVRYLKGVLELFPDYDLKPIHHYALHIPDILSGFGPLHGTWAFTLERLIGRMQKMNTNHKNGAYNSSHLLQTSILNLIDRRDGGYCNAHFL